MCEVSRQYEYEEWNESQRDHMRHKKHIFILATREDKPAKAFYWQDVFLMMQITNIYTDEL